MLNLSQALAQEWAAAHVRVNAVSPGWIRTEINRAFTDNVTTEAATAADVPLGRWGLPDDICGALLWLASDASSYVTGAHITIDGGSPSLSPKTGVRCGSIGPGLNPNRATGLVRTVDRSTGADGALGAAFQQAAFSGRNDAQQ